MKNDLLVKEQFDKDDGGVYGIFINDECVYVGSTKNFQNRMNTHNSLIGIQSPKNPKGMYEDLGCGFSDKAEFRVLASIRDLMRMSTYPANINEQAIDAIELAFIRQYKPKYNTKGVDMTFDFDHVATKNWRSF